MDISVQLETSISYPGSPFQFVGSDCFCYRSGNSLKFFNLSSRVDHIWNESSGDITAMTASVSASRLACAVDVPVPSILVYSHPERTLLHTLTGVTKLSYKSLAISLCGTYLGALGGDVDDDLSLFDLTKGEMVPDANFKVPGACSSLSFNPFDKSRQCLSGENGMYVCRITDHFNTSEVSWVSCQMPVKGVVDHEGREPIKRESLVKYFCHLWKSSDVVMGSTYEGQLVTFSALSGELQDTITLEPGLLAESMLLTKTHVIIGCNDSSIRWMNLESKLVDVSVTLTGEELSVRCIQYSPDFKTLIAGREDGSLFSMNIQNITKPPTPGRQAHKKVDQTKKVALRTLGDFPCGSVTSCCYFQLEDQTLFCTGGDDRKIRIWNPDCQLVASIALSSTVTALSGSPCRPFFGVGTSEGEVCLVGRSIDEENDSSVAIYFPFDRSRHLSHPISQLLFHPSYPLLLSYNYQDPTIYMCLTHPNSMSKPYAVISLPSEYTITNIQFHLDILVIFTSHGTIFSVEIPSPSGGASGELLQLVPQIRNRIGLAPFASCIVPLEVLTGNAYYFAASYTDPSIRLYLLPEDLSATPALSQQPSEPLEPFTTFTSHSSGITVLSVPSIESGVGESYIASGSLDGSIVIWSVLPSEVKLHSRLRPHSSAVTSLSFSPDAKQLLSASVDGSVVITKLSGSSAEHAKSSCGARASRVKPPPGELHGLDSLLDIRIEEFRSGALVPQGDSPSQLHLSLQKLNESAIRHGESLVQEKQRVLSELRSELVDLIAANEKSDDLERLDRFEFVIDTKRYLDVLQRQDQDQKSLKQSIARQDAVYDSLKKRYIREFWDTMEVKSCSVRGFKSKSMIRNYPLRKRDPDHEQSLSSIRLLRLSEISMLHRKNWMSNAGKLKFDDSPERKDEDADMVEIDETKVNLVSLMYPPCACRSSVQKRMQCYMVDAYIRQMKQQFNKLFDEMFTRKKDDDERIRSKNVRIDEIVAELKIEPDHFVPHRMPDEDPNDMHHVSTADVPIERYICEDERKRLQAESEEAERLRKLKENSPEERALREMMDGVLEKKQDLNALDELLKPEQWMIEVSPLQWTDQQKVQFKQFEDRKKSIEEEKDQKKKALELELRKLKTEVNDIVRLFDESLQESFKKMLASQMEIYTQELYLSRLQMSILEKEKDTVTERQYSLELLSLQKQEERLRSQVESMEQEVSQYTQEFEELSAHDKDLLNNFKKNMEENNQKINPDTFKVYRELFRKGPGRNFRTTTVRPSASGFSTSTSRTQSSYSRRTSSFRRTTSRNISSMSTDKKVIQINVEAEPEAESIDPYEDARRMAESVQKERENMARALFPLAPSDAPDGFRMDSQSWERLQKLRLDKIKVELDLKRKKQTLDASRARLSELKQSHAQILSSIDRKNEELRDHQTQMSYHMNNLPVIIKVKSGLHEVSMDSIITDYSDSVLLNRSEIEEINQRILKLGDERIGTLHKMANFKKDINFMEWENEYLTAMEKHMTEFYSDVHMMPANKAMQKFLKQQPGESNVPAVSQDELNEQRMKALTKNFTDKMRSIEFQMDGIRKQIQQKKRENSMLSDQLSELGKNVSSRRAILDCRQQGGESSLDQQVQSRKRMEAVVARRKLIDLAKSQTDEIEYLRQELDRLRQKTFPYFAQVSQWIPPDDATL